MLRITQQARPQDAKRYYSAADYLAEGQELVGRWGGRAARDLGLAGVVDKISFERLCDNRDPRDGRPLTARTRTDRTVGYDLTFSVPKSVSLLYALAGDPAAILDAFRGAVEETMREIEREMKTRIRKAGGDTDRTTGNMVWAEFVHTTARPVGGVPDPHLHAHCFAFNATWDSEERRWKAGQFRDLKRDAPYFQAAFRVRLASRLHELGYGITRKRDDFEIAGFAPALLKRFSRRTDLIETLADERGVTDPQRKAELGAQTREKKARNLSWSKLRTAWRQRLTPEEQDGLARVQSRDAPAERPAPGERAAVDYALDHAFARAAVVPERTLVTHALQRGIGSVTVEGVRRELFTRPLVRGEQAGRALATTRDLLGLENRLVAFARDGRGRCRPLAEPNRPFVRDWLNDGQKAAVRHVLGSRDRVTLLRGAAGTGKTKLEEELRDALRETQRPLVALAPSAEASRGVLRREAGFATADTVARFLNDRNLRESARGGVILLDEASLLGTRDLLALFERADELKARLVLVGDTAQHRSVAAGEPLKLLEERAGLPVARVTDIIRQSGDYRRATAALSRGDVTEGFAELDRLGWVREVADGERYQTLADAYRAAIAEKKTSGEYKTALVVSPTHAEAAQVTSAIRAGLKAAGQLGSERVVPVWVPTHRTAAEKGDPTAYEPGEMLQFHQNTPGHKIGARLVVADGSDVPIGHPDRFEVYRPAHLALAVGDRLRVTAGGRTKDGRHRLDNGAMLKVRGFTPRGDLVVDHGWVVDKDFGHLAHGYVVTSHASQGKTVDQVLIAQSSASLAASNRRQFYVSVSRGRERAVVFTDDKEALRRAVERPDESLSATALARSRRPTPLRDRLRERLAFTRRLASFAQTHAPPRRRETYREVHHVR